MSNQDLKQETQPESLLPTAAGQPEASLSVAAQAVADEAEERNSLNQERPAEAEAPGQKDPAEAVEQPAAGEVSPAGAQEISLAGPAKSSPLAGTSAAEGPHGPDGQEIPDGQSGPASPDGPHGPDGPDGPDDNTREAEEEPAAGLTLLDHFRELRNRLIKSFLAIVAGFLICWVLRAYLVDFLYAPLLSALRATGQPETIIATGVAEKFFTYMKIAFVGGIFVGSPFIFYQLWAFIAPGLYDEEKVFIVPVAVASAFFFILGGSFCYFVVFPNALPFLLGFGEEYMRDTPKMSEYYGFALQLLVAFGLIFEMPLFIFFLARLGIVTSKMLGKFRRYFVVIAFVAAAVLTPPDVMSQLLMAAPMLLLYEFSIIIAKIFGKEKKKKAQKEEEPAEREAEA